jgi:hypothetical protein
MTIDFNEDILFSAFSAKFFFGFLKKSKQELPAHYTTNRWQKKD